MPPRIDGRRLSHETSAAVRRLAVQRVVRGEEPSTVMARYGLCRTTIYRWLRSARSGGLAALAARRHPGTRARVSPKDAQAVRGFLLDHSPNDHGISGRLWTRRAVADLVRRRTGTTIGPLAAGRLLRRIGLDRGSAGAFSSDTGPRGESCVLLATDGRGSFLCSRVGPSPSPDVVRRAAAALVRKAGRPVRFHFVTDSSG